MSIIRQLGQAVTIPLPAIKTVYALMYIDSYAKPKSQMNVFVFTSKAAADAELLLITSSDKVYKPWIQTIELDKPLVKR